ncbi:2-oxoglutarate dehydrogenase complex dihydrolipoyllysine-residue succinyltransferase [Paenibacillus agricola]|uniref:Dihydrolipoyllysine-residue succinyltransferase component of 2-oxoglutarate dehydrogenase complex n=1 Tax=Paenibacillus agricola TaxID=2716264 RepID=A0ABX0JB40_9BACL|nr:2-oxoglutarate dehydrogenase complex dihydrolipoyllysine-residue succinyltransferase [Paenibacillus agricola]NHN31993.1 2-oxoglutarate dehydrogenase complex dihydrolipoyllysine-residue succinyltransferase [Paenibacillus agricola]
MDIKIPELGESITEGTISSWMKNEGDAVKFGDLLLELETDKVNLEINAEADGILQKITRQAGDTVQVGESVGVISAGAAGGAGGQEAAKAPAEGSGGAAAESAGKPAVAAPADAGGAKNDSGPAAETNEDGAYTASPSVRKLARERGIDLNQARPVNGVDTIRVSRGDLDAFSSQAASNGTQQAQPQQVQAQQAGPAAGAADASKPTERKKMSRRRVTIANRLVEAQRTAAMLTTFNEVDMTAIMDLRKRRKQSFQEKNNVGLGFMSFFTKAVVGALKTFPLLNAEIEGEDILVKKYYDIGIAVGAKEGLVVPVVRDADRLSFAEIERKIGELAVKARDNKLALADLQGGTFTITNGGVFGSLLSTPILNTPQVGILGMHTIQRRPVAIGEDGIENRPMMYLALSYDHRIVDGSEAVRFLVTVKQLLEDPEALLLEG